MAKLINISVQSALQAGDYTAAVDSTVLLLRFADVQLARPAGIAFLRAGWALQGMGLASVEVLLDERELSDADLHRLSAALGKLGLHEAGMSYAVMSEYEALAWRTDMIADGNYEACYLGGGVKRLLRSMSWLGLRPYVFKKNKTKVMFATSCRALMAEFSVAYCDGYLRYIEAPAGGSLSLGQLYPNRLGEAFWRSSVQSFSDVYEQKIGAECRLSALQLVSYCKVFAREHGDLPANLQALVPVYMAAVPRDPYDGGLFRYDREKAIVYAVGVDTIDGGGARELRAGLAGGRASGRWLAEDVVFDIGAVACSFSGDN